jgi:Na+-transporting NADH:ubiquinone oxidoreductase subunit B
VKKVVGVFCAFFRAPLHPCLIFGMFNAGYQHHLAFGDIQQAAGEFLTLDSTFWTMDNFF